MPLDRPGISLTLNGRKTTLAAPASARLSEVLRESAGALDVKIGCNAGDCGACTVLLDGEPVCACITAAGQAEGRNIETQAGLVARDARQRLWPAPFSGIRQRNAGFARRG